MSTSTATTNSTIQTITQKAGEEEGSWLAIPLSVLASVFALTIITVAIQYYINKDLKRDIANLVEKKKKLETAPSPTQRVTDKTAETEEDDEEEEEAVEEQKLEKKEEVPTEASFSLLTEPKSILKKEVASPVEASPSLFFFSSEELEGCLIRNATLIFSHHKSAVGQPETASKQVNTLSVAGYLEYVKRNIQPNEKAELSKAIAFAEMLVASLWISVVYWENSSLAELEALALNWLGRLIGLSEEFLFSSEEYKPHGGGCFTDNSDESLLLAVLSARTGKVNRAIGNKVQHYLSSRKDMTKVHKEEAKMVVYGRKEDFPQLERICQIATVICRPVEGKIDKQSLEEMIKTDSNDRHRPGLLVLAWQKDTAETLAQIIEIAERNKIVVHVDCNAAVAATWLSPTAQPSSLPADTVSISLAGLTAIFARDPCSFRSLFSQADFSKHMKGGFNPTEWQVHERRRLKGFQLWFIFHLLGAKRLCEELLPK